MRSTSEDVERALDVGRRALLAGMGDAVQAEPAGLGEDPRELLRRMAALAAVEADADEVLAIGQRVVQRLQRLVLAQVAQEAQDQVAREAELALGPGAGARQAADHGADRHAARGVRLRVEEQLGADDVVGGGAAEVRHRHRLEVALVQQDAGAGVVDVEEALQVGERVGRAQRLDVG